MNSTWSTLTILLSASILSSCAFGPSELVQNSLKVAPGQTKENVVSILGTPQDRQFFGKNEAWQYCRTAWELGGQDDFILVWLYDGVVTGVNTYKNTINGHCQNFLREVNWEDAPDRTITIRNR